MCYHVKFGIVMRQMMYAKLEGNPKIGECWAAGPAQQGWNKL